MPESSSSDTEKPKSRNASSTKAGTKRGTVHSKVNNPKKVSSPTSHTKGGSKKNKKQEDDNFAQPSTRLTVSDREKRMRKRNAEGDPSTSKDPLILKTIGDEPSAKKFKTINDEEVQKVKLNTGTLYIYRGRRPRVEFIRRY